jgi:AcrR family transcriptional regulator
MLLLTLNYEKNRPDGLLSDRLDGMHPADCMIRPPHPLKDVLLDAAETVAAREGVSRLTFDAVAAEAGVSKGGLLHHFSSKDHLIEAMVKRTADGWRKHFTESYQSVPEGPGRMARAILKCCLTDAQTWTEQLRRSYAAVFAALAHDPALIQPMRDAYTELYRLVAEDNLPPSVSETVVTAIDGLWLHWVLRLRPVDQSVMDRLRASLETMLNNAVAEQEKNADGARQ